MEFSNRNQKKSLKLAVAFLFWIATAIYLSIGISRCLPMRCYADEARFIRLTPLLLNKKFDKFYSKRSIWNHPGHTISHLIWLVSYSLYLKERMFSQIENIDQFITKHKTSQLTQLFFIGRVINLAFSLGAVYLTYLLTKKVLKQAKINTNYTYLSAFSLLTNGLFLIFAKFTRTDIPQTFFILLAVFFLWQGLTKNLNNKANFFLFGFFTGLATMTKWPRVLAISLMIILLSLTYFSPEKQKFRKILIICLLSLSGLTIGLFCGSPAWPKYINQIKRDVLKEARAHHLGADNFGFLGNFIFYQKVLLSSFGLSSYLFFS